MSHRFLAATSVVALVIVAALMEPGNLAGQTESATKPTATKTAASAKPWTPPHTPDGQPDLQGVWDYRTITPLERPKELGTKAFFTEEEAAKYEKTRESASESRFNRSGNGRFAIPAGRRRSLQRILVRPGQQSRGDQAHVLDRGSARRPPSRLDAGGAETSGPSCGRGAQ